MDGMKTKTLLDEEKGKISLGNCGSITRLYDPLKPISYGNKIELKLGTATVDKQIESLVYFDILTQKLKDKKIKLIQSDFSNQKILIKTKHYYHLLTDFSSLKKKNQNQVKMLDENEIVAFDNEMNPNIQLVRVGSLGENHCFYHSYMYSTSEKYRNASHEQKENDSRKKKRNIRSNYIRRL